MLATQLNKLATQLNKAGPESSPYRSFSCENAILLYRLDVAERLEDRLAQPACREHCRRVAIVALPFLLRRRVDGLERVRMQAGAGITLLGGINGGRRRTVIVPRRCTLVGATPSCVPGSKARLSKGVLEHLDSALSRKTIARPMDADHTSKI